MAEKVNSSRRLPAVLQLPSRVFTYRFFLSVCLLILILFSLTFQHSKVGIFVLALINFLFCADVFAQCAWKDLTVGRIGLPMWVTVSVFGGFLYSSFNTFLTRTLFGPSTELYLYVSLFITISLWVCRRFAQQKELSRVFIKKLDDFLPKAGRLCVGHQFRKVFAQELKQGEIIFVKTGERLPCDGIVRKGKTSIDEQLITGNMLPTSKTVGSRVYAGTLNKSADVYVEVTETLEHSALMTVISAIKKGETRRGNFKISLDKWCAVFLAITLLCAVGGYAFMLSRHGADQWFYYSGILLAGCALGSPLALLFISIFPSFFARSGARGAKIKIQNLQALEDVVQADTFFFDKTGTLTYGELRVSGVYPVKPSLEKQLLEAVAAAEQLVDGPFADAVNGYAKKKGVKVRRVLCFDVLPGLGVQATCGEDKILAGRSAWLEEQGVKTSTKADHMAEAVICVAKNRKFLGYLTLSDELRRGANELVSFLHEQKKELVLVSGDNESSVAYMAQQAGIAKVNANVLPKTKAEIVSNLRAMGKKVVMVGDGFNDIIALLRADAGVVFSSGRNVYNNWVDVIIKRRDLYSLLDLFTINKKLRRITAGNACFAFGLNAALTGYLFWRGPGNSGWHWAVGGSLAIVLLIWLNSARLLKIK